MPSVWAAADLEAHLLECPDLIDISIMSEATPRPMCGCGEASQHTPLAVALAELEAETPKVYL